MNQKGQTLILFVILLPLFLLVIAAVVDVGLIAIEKNKLLGVTTAVIKEALNNEKGGDIDSQIKESLQKNNVPIKNLKLTIMVNAIEVENQYQIKSIFGNIIGKKEYEITIHKRVEKE